jgi:hypothetical protein
VYLLTIEEIYSPPQQGRNFDLIIFFLISKVSICLFLFYSSFFLLTFSILAPTFFLFLLFFHLIFYPYSLSLLYKPLN